MECSKHFKLVVVGVCALLVLSMAGDVNAACSLSQVRTCTSAVIAPNQMPSQQCCSELSAITDFNCFCSMLLNQGTNLNQDYINNALLIPSKCGEQGRNLRGQRCGSKLYYIAQQF